MTVPLIDLLALFPLFPRRVLDGFERMFALWDCVQRGNSGDKGSSKVRKTGEKVDNGATGGRKKTQRSRCPLRRKQGKLPPRRILRFGLSDVNFGLLR